MVLRSLWSFTHLVYIFTSSTPPSFSPLTAIQVIKLNYHKTKTFIFMQTYPCWKALFFIISIITARRTKKTKWMQKATIYHGNPLGLSCSRKFLLPLLKVPTFVETVEMIYCQVEHQTSWNSSIDSLNTSGASQHCWCFSTLLVLLNTAGAS